MVDRCVDFRYPEGYPDWRKALADGTRVVRCISLPEMEADAAIHQEHGIRVIGVYTGESDNAGRYVMTNISALIIGNEPGFIYQSGEASWPAGTIDDMVNVWGYVANVLVPAVHGTCFPLIGPGIWCQDFASWAQLAPYLPGLSAAAVHVYPGPSGQTVAQVRSVLASYRAVRPDLPLLCTEWTARQPNVLAYARAIDAYCTMKLWYGPGVAGHELEGTPEFGILTLASR